MRKTTGIKLELEDTNLVIAPIGKSIFSLAEIWFVHSLPCHVAINHFSVG